MNDREKLIELLKKTEITKINGHSALAETCFTPHVFENMADHLLANGVTVQRWIPVTERLPKDRNERVLVKIRDAHNIIGHPDMDTDRYVVDSWVRWGENVTHWMPLPEPPNE